MNISLDEGERRRAAGRARLGRPGRQGRGARLRYEIGDRATGMMNEFIETNGVATRAPDQITD